MERPSVGGCALYVTYHLMKCCVLTNKHTFAGTFEPQDMKEIITRSIRNSAQDSLIRLLPLSAFDTSIPAEIEKLQAQKVDAQARYLEGVQMRTKALESIDGDVVDLAEIVNRTDTVVEELVRVTDQMGQMRRLMDVQRDTKKVRMQELRGDNMVC